MVGVVHQWRHCATCACIVHRWLGLTTPCNTRLHLGRYSFFCQPELSAEQMYVWHGLHRMFARRPYVPMAESTTATAAEPDPTLFLYNAAFIDDSAACLLPSSAMGASAESAGAGHDSAGKDGGGRHLPGAVLLKEAAASEDEITNHAPSVMVDLQVKSRPCRLRGACTMPQRAIGLLCYREPACSAACSASLLLNPCSETLLPACAIA